MNLTEYLAATTERARESECTMCDPRMRPYIIRCAHYEGRTLLTHSHFHVVVNHAD